MAKSIKLADDTYVDATGVYDSNRNQTQEYMNKLNGSSRYFITGDNTTATISIEHNWDKGCLLIFGNGNGTPAIVIITGTTVSRILNGSSITVASHSVTSAGRTWEISGLYQYGAWGVLASAPIKSITSYY